MLGSLKNKRAQTTMEYAILIVVVIGVFSAMQLYMRRGLSARLKSGVDNIPDQVLRQAQTAGGDAWVFGNDTQYEPYYTAQGASDMATTSSEGTEKGTISQTGGVRDLTNATTARKGNQTIVGPDFAD